MQSTISKEIHYPFFTWENYFRLAGIRADYCVSIFIPTYREGRQMEGNEASNRLRDELSLARKELEKTDLGAGEINQMLALAQSLLGDSLFWGNQADGLALFIGPNQTRHYALPLHFEQQTIVADRFLLKPILPFFNHDGRFYLLLLSPEVVRLYECSRHAITEIEITDLFPASLQHAGEENGSIDGATEKYLKAVDDGLGEFLNRDPIPMVLACSDEFYKAYEDVTSYPHLFDSHISGNPLNEPILMLHEKAWDLIGNRFKNEMEEKRDDLRENSKLVVAGIRDILPLAVNGKIETLFIRNGFEVWGSRENGIVELSSETSENQPHIPLVNEAALQTFFQGGKVYLLPESENPIPSQPIIAQLRDPDGTMVYMDTLMTTINKLETKGFTAQFYLEESAVGVSGSDKKYQPTQLKIVESHRFEGMSNPSDSSQLFAIVTDDGLKGTLVVSFGAKSSENANVLLQLEYIQQPLPNS